MANNRTAAGEIMKILGQRDQRNSVAQVTKRERGGATSWTDLSNHHATHQTGGNDVISVDDTMINDRTLTDINAPTSSTGRLTVLLGWLANMIKSITGKASWITAPSATLEDVATHIANSTIHEHNRVRAATTLNVVLSGTQTIDDVVLVEGDRVLVKDQTIGNENGVYTVSSGVWSRATDFDAQTDIVSGLEFYVMDGTLNKKRTYNLTTIEPIVLNTTALTFEPLAGGTGSKHTIEDEGVVVTDRTKLNFVGANVAVTDDAANDATIVTVSAAAGSKHIIEDEGVVVTDRTKLNFVGANVAVTDDAANDATIVTVSAASLMDDVSPNPTTDDVEFTSALSGWTNVGVCDILNANADIASHLHVKVNSNGTAINGIYRTLPATRPITVTVKFTDFSLGVNYHNPVFFLSDGIKYYCVGPIFDSSPKIELAPWSSRTVRTSFTDSRYSRPIMYFRYIITSDTNVTVQFSNNGLVWNDLITGLNPGFTLSYIGVGVNAFAAIAVELYVDWIRYGSSVIKTSVIV